KTDIIVAAADFTLGLEPQLHIGAVPDLPGNAESAVDAPASLANRFVAARYTAAIRQGQAGRDLSTRHVLLAAAPLIAGQIRIAGQLAIRLPGHIHSLPDPDTVSGLIGPAAHGALATMPDTQPQRAEVTGSDLGANGRGQQTRRGLHVRMEQPFLGGTHRELALTGQGTVRQVTRAALRVVINGTRRQAQVPRGTRGPGAAQAAVQPDPAQGHLSIGQPTSDWRAAQCNPELVSPVAPVVATFFPVVQPQPLGAHRRASDT